MKKPLYFDFKWQKKTFLHLKILLQEILQWTQFFSKWENALARVNYVEGQELQANKLHLLSLTPGVADQIVITR